ncbi:CR1L protein, partial [Myiagra hebetior]|nr:CR1L protein [Myiagra hebetior]
ALRWLCALLLALPGAAGVCLQPPKIDFAEPITVPQQSYPEGTVVRYRCRPGYARKGGESPDVTCLANSTWSTTSAFCTRKSCGPPHIENGHFRAKTDLLLGATVTFICQAGYRLVGSPTAQCVVRNGEVSWTAVPSCEIVLCPSPAAVENGQLLSPNENFTFGMPASYSCNEGFSLIGEATIYCTIGRGFQGVWDSPPPECKAVKCENPQVKNGNKSSGSRTEYTYGNKVSFECNSGYSMKGSSIVTCEANSTWTPSLPTCDKILCGDPPEFPFASITTPVGGSSAFETKVQYRCNPGYRQAPGTSSVMICQSNSSWSAANPLFCVPAQCPSPRVPYGWVSPDRSYYSTWDTVTFSCSPGYALQGPRSSTCGPDSRWNPPLPQCKKEVKCPRPPSIANGLHSGQSSDKFSRGVTVSYSCKEGFELLGNVSITCTGSGVWSRPLPRCEG